VWRLVFLGFLTDFQKCEKWARDTIPKELVKELNLVQPQCQN